MTLHRKNEEVVEIDHVYDGMLSVPNGCSSIILHGCTPKRLFKGKGYTLGTNSVFGYMFGQCQWHGERTSVQNVSMYEISIENTDFLKQF